MTRFARIVTVLMLSLTTSAWGQSEHGDPCGAICMASVNEPEIKKLEELTSELYSEYEVTTWNVDAVQVKAFLNVLAGSPNLVAIIHDAQRSNVHLWLDGDISLERGFEVHGNKIWIAPGLSADEYIALLTGEKVDD